MLDWNYQPFLSHYEMILFQSVIGQHRDYLYYPVSVARRHEIGTKYRYLCIAKKNHTDSGYDTFANIEIYQPLRGKPYPTRIHRIDFDCFYYHGLK
ncbi:MAG: hypothetical protein K0S47_126 [Herbinix sp.]|jgi:hypothetical protein|nr:hypothetical protein [Herbinix sp.]